MTPLPEVHPGDTWKSVKYGTMYYVERVTPHDVECKVVPDLKGERGQFPRKWFAENGRLVLVERPKGEI